MSTNSGPSLALSAPMKFRLFRGEDLFLSYGVRIYGVPWRGTLTMHCHWRVSVAHGALLKDTPCPTSQETVAALKKHAGPCVMG